MNRFATMLGIDISPNDTFFIASVSNGIAVVVNGREYFLSFSDFPWFEYCSIAELRDVTSDKWGVYWKSVGIDLSIDSLEHPEKHPVKISVEAWRRQLAARMLGSACSPQKTTSSRANGAKGGRPRKTALRA